MEFTITFIQIFSLGVYLMSPILIIMAMLIVFLGLIVGHIEWWSKFDAIYWAFITALTVGYGDIKPLKKTSKIISVFIGAFGIMLGGILVAITVETSSNAFYNHTSPEQIQNIKNNID